MLHGYFYCVFLSAIFSQPDVGWLTWGPVVDKYTRNRDYQFMSDLPENLLKKGNIKFNPDFAYMTGVTRDEGSQAICKKSFSFKTKFE